MRYGYARVSTTDQDCAIQVAELRAAGCEHVRQERKSGRTVDGRDELKTLLAQLQKGDELWVSRLDRLGRSVHDVSGIVRDFIEKGVVLKSIHENLDTATSFGRAMLHFLALFGELDYDMRRERQAAGIAKARAEDGYKTGRPRKAPSREEVAAAVEAEGTTRAAERFGVSARTIQRALKVA